MNYNHEDAVTIRTNGRKNDASALCALKDVLEGKALIYDGCPCTKMRAADALCGVILHLFVDKSALFAYDKGNTENCVKLAVKRRVRTVCA